MAINVPVRFADVPHDFVAQFDLGSDATIIYGQAVQPYLERYPAFARKLDTVHTEVIIDGVKQGEFHDVDLMLGRTAMHLSRFPYFRTFGDDIPPDSVDTPTPKHIGTIGADLFHNKVLVIDFPRQRFTVFDSLASTMQRRFDFVEARMEHGRMFIPLTIGDSTRSFIFDTGASMFPMVTDSTDWASMTNGNSMDTVTSSSWGVQHTMVGAMIGTSVHLGHTLLAPMRAYRVSVPGILDYFKSAGVHGLVGNSYFLGSTIAIDYRGARFGILKDGTL